ncbi:MAG TPA: hypothetical protein VHF45_10840 [Thermoleophilaceae bacterium]|nr:hypothetical protein [Thermoleophilaceae bacterium]
MERAYRQSTRVLGLVLVLLGIAVLVSTLARGGGVTAVGVFVGIGLTAFGGARLYLAAQASDPPGGR